MKIELKVDYKYYNSIKKSIEVLMPQLEIVRSDQRALLRVITVVNVNNGIEVKSYLESDPYVNEVIIDTEILEDRYDEVDFKKRVLARIKLALYRLLVKVLDEDMSLGGS